VDKRRRYIAFDIGASNGRCIVGEFDGEKLTLTTVNRFDNGYVQLLDHFHWDILGLFNQVKLSLLKAANTFGGSLAGIGVDTWGLDFGLLDEKGALIGNPYCYRDPQTNGMIEEAFRRVSRQEIFETTGLQFMQINTLFHLLAMVIHKSPQLSIADKFLMIPDLINYWLTGTGACEYTNVHTEPECEQKSGPLR
jgi:sugar (pentulose or hexulose) kinase